MIIYDDEELMLSADEAVRIVWNELEAGLLKDLESWAHSRGVEEQQVKRVVNLYAVWLNEIRSRRLRTTLEVLQAVRSSATGIQ